MNMADALTASDGEDHLTQGQDFRSGRRDFLRASAAAGVSGLVAPFSEAVSAAESAKPGEGLFELGDMVLQSGETLHGAKIAYKTHGRLNPDKSNAILYPTPYSAQHGDIEWLIGPGKALDPDKYFIVVLDQLGNGLSSSPSNAAPPQERARFPVVTNQDNVAAQHRLATVVTTDASPCRGIRRTPGCRCGRSPRRSGICPTRRKGRCDKCPRNAGR